MPSRVVVFIDWQNAYRSARYAFFDERDYHIEGQFDPVGLANLIMAADTNRDRTLEQVRVYTGRPSASKDPKTYSAHMKHCTAWQRAGAIVIPRTLRYPHDWPKEKAREKGIDVKLAVDYVALAHDDDYDVGVLVSHDTDLLPPLEHVSASFAGSKTVEVAAWKSSSARFRLNLPGKNMWCHWLDRSAFDSIADTTDYSL